MGFIDDNGYKEIMNSTLLTKSELDSGNFVNAANLREHTKIVIKKVTKGIDFYNVLHAVPFNAPYNGIPDIKDLMTGKVSEALNIPKNVVWGAQAVNTYTKLYGDLMKPVIDFGKYKKL